ncbi:TetR/AcrR family transcriptional regulator [Acutalibacter muris]|uniref:TetR/AcrR family transcriptional regulator n=1 Tax=Acutalibacter muris TaxID=1796620 RepID=UPI0039B8D99D
MGYDKITLKLLAEHLNVQPPSLYNHIKGIEELQKEIVLFGWRQMDKALMINSY